MASARQPTRSASSWTDWSTTSWYGWSSEELRAPEERRRRRSMEDPTAALLYGTLALRAAGRTPSAADLVRLAHFLGVPEPSPLLLAAVTALVEQPAGARPAPASSRLPAPEGDVPHPQLLPDPPA